jgi:carboxypeptidase PM20D1
MFDNVPVAPMLMLGGTDARNYHEICESVYRFIPLVFTSEDMKRVHGTNERVSVEGMARLVQFFAQIMQVWGSPLVEK